MTSFQTLEPYWIINPNPSNLTIGSYSVYFVHVTSKTRPNEHRIAYFNKNAKRWRFSPYLGLSSVEGLLADGKRDVRSGHFDLRGLRHSIRIYAVQLMPDRWRAHRKKMEKQKELREMEHLPSFGIF